MGAVDDVTDFAQAIKAAHREVMRRGNEAVRPLGLTAAQAEAVAIIAADEPLALHELGGRIVAESGHPSRLVDRLVAAGLVERRVAADDRRRVELTLSAKGRELVPRLEVAYREMVQAAAADLAGHELGAATAALRAFVESGR
jgi:DNA-binding MarR family transcriptional regulator